ELYTTPCADGEFAFGDTDACGDNVVEYTAMTMEDPVGVNFQDEFVSEASSLLNNDGCVDNVVIGLDDFDTSGYFFTGAQGVFASHFGTARGEEGMGEIVSRLANPRAAGTTATCTATVASKVMANDLNSFPIADAAEMTLSN
ncbi:MAG: hypothetical protein AAF658_21405, partial [Myxococcota bacterium]